MNLPTIIIGALILVLFIWALKKSFKDNSCSGNCATCHTSCSSKNQNGDGTPDWVKQYRKDHPKKEN